MAEDEHKGKLIGQGYTAEIYELGKDKILKLYRKSLPDFLCELEFNATKNIYDRFKISPYAYRIVEIEGRKGAIYEKVVGKTMLEEMVSRIWTLKKQSRELAHLHLSIHKKIDFILPTVKTKLKKDIQRVPELSDVEKEYLYQYIDTLPNGDTLCHFDFHPGNIIIRNGKAVVIDWMTASKGHASSDVARTSVMLKYSDVPLKSSILKKLVRRIKLTVYNEYIKEYLKISETEIKDIEIWEFPIAAARLSEWVPKDEKARLLDLVRKQMKYTNTI